MPSSFLLAHIWLSIDGDAYGEDGSIPSAVYGSINDFLS